MAVTTDSKTYPQFTASSSERGRGDAFGGLDAFRFGGAVQNRPACVSGVEKTENGVILTLKTSARRAVLSYTHETSLYLYENAEATVGEVYLGIEFWTNGIFRVALSKDKEPSDRFASIPEDMRMLVAKPERVDLSLNRDEGRIILSTDTVTIRIDESTAATEACFADGKVFYSRLIQEMFTADVYDLALAEADGKYACFEALELENDEVIYGLGERFDSVVRNGRTVDFRNKDAIGTTNRRTYINVPFFLSTKGYGLFLNSGAHTDWQIGTTDTGALQFGLLDDRMEYFVIPGRTPKDIIKGYCGLTGFSKLPPLWSFGLWMSRNSYLSWEVVDEVAENIRKNDIPCDVLHLDTAWFERDWNCDLKFSKERFPDPEENIARYGENGFKISLWQYNFIPPNADNEHYLEAVRQGYTSKNAEGEPYVLPLECKGSWTDDVTVDFSDPDARKWYGEKIAKLIRLGARAIKTDFGEGIAEDAIYKNIEGRFFHNLYSLVYNATVFEASKAVSGENLVWARSGTAGSQRYPIHWGGDSQCSFEGLAGTVRAALSVGMSGIPFFSHDIGGFIGTPDDELYVRWAQVGLFSSHSRCHGSGNDNYREPWRFSTEACEIFRYYDKLRYSLMPYIYSEAEKCTRTGLPMMRALYLEYPEDRNVLHIDDEYLFGDSLLIAPVLKSLKKTDIRRVYLPKGRWYDFFTKERIESKGEWIERRVDLRTMPIYVKAGTLLEYCEVSDSLKNGMGRIVNSERYE